MSGARVALFIGCSDYDDPRFQHLPAPAQDIDALTRVLVDPAIGDFTVEALLNESSSMVTVKIERFFADRKPDDLLLLYFSCHGVLDARGRLYFVAADTRRELLGSTGISAQWIKQQMDHGRSQRIVLLFDCCYSGAFIKGLPPTSGDAGEIVEKLEGRGRVIITASDKMEYSYESEFTDAIVRGLETGAADLDGDGQVEVGELYRYVHDQVCQNTSGQTPTMSADGIRGRLYLARNPHAPLPLPAELDQVLTSATVWKRRWAVDGLRRLLAGDHPGGQKLTARKSLVRLRDQDADDDVRAAAERALTELSQPPERDPPRRDRRLVKVVVTVVSVALLSVTSLLVMSKAPPGDAIPCSPSTRPANGVLSLGTLIPTTGAQTFRSPAVETGVQLAKEDITAGGIPNVAVQFDRANQRDEGDALIDQIVRQSTGALLENGVDVIIGPVTSAAAITVIDTITCAGVIMFSPANLAPLFTTHPDHGLYFRNAPTTVLEAAVLGKLVVDDGNSTAVVMSRDDVYGNSLREETGKVIEKSGGRVLDSFPLDPRVADYDKEIRRVKDKKPDAIVLIGFTESARALRSMIKEGLSPRNKRVYGSNSSMNNTLVGRVDPRNPDVLKGMRGTLIDPGDETFVKRLKEANPTILDPAYAAQAYDAAVVTALAAAVANTDEPASVAKEINGVTKDGERCVSFAACMMLVKDRKNIDYDGPSGPLEFADPGEPPSATYWISEFQADGTVKLLKSVRVPWPGR